MNAAIPQHNFVTLLQLVKYDIELGRVEWAQFAAFVECRCQLFSDVHGMMLSRSHSQGTQ